MARLPIVHRARLGSDALRLELVLFTVCSLTADAADLGLVAFEHALDIDHVIDGAIDSTVDRVIDRMVDCAIKLEWFIGDRPNG